jgi:hypothetical protein
MCKCLIIKWAHLGLNQGLPDYERGNFIRLKIGIVMMYQLYSPILLALQI